MSFTAHDEGCTPFKPCETCMIVRFLKENLAEDAFEEFRALVFSRILNQKISGLFAKEIGDSMLMAGIHTVEHLTFKTEQELLCLPSFTCRHLNEVKEFLRSNDLELSS